MADKFYNDIELPELVNSPLPPAVGFVQLYGKDKKLVVMDSDGVETILAANSFATINVNGVNGTSIVSDSPTGTLLLNQGKGISIIADAVKDSIMISNSDTGSRAILTHTTDSDPHPQYLTQTEADVLYKPIDASSGATFQHAVLTATQTNTTVTEATLTDHTFIIPPGKSARIDGILVFTGASKYKGAYYGVQVVHGAGADGNAVGSWIAYVNVSSGATATGLSDGNVFNLAGGASTPAGSGVLGTGTAAGNNSAQLGCIVKNTSTNANTTVNIMFRSEADDSAITAQIGTSATCIIS